MRTNPDFVWIGLGAPKQERWMAEHQGKVKGFMVGVGAGFDYFAGNIRRAPEWMQKCNLEWVYRLLQDPKRLFGRYWHTNTKFIWNVMVRGKIDSIWCREYKINSIYLCVVLGSSRRAI